MQFPFNARQVDPAVAFQPLPAGDYPVKIVDTSFETADSGGKYIKFEMEVLQGHPFAGRKLFFNCNIENASTQAVEIAYGQLSAICHVTGVYDMTQTEQLHNIPFMVTVKIDKSGYNSVKGFKDMQGNDPGKTGQPGAPAATATPPPAQYPPAQHPPQQGYQPQQGYGTPPPPAATPAAAYPPQQQQQQPPPGYMPQGMTPAATAPPPSQPPVDPSASWQRSPDGQWKMNPATGQWEPNTPPQQQPPPSYAPGGATQPPPQQQQPPQQGWTQGAPQQDQPSWVQK